METFPLYAPIRSNHPVVFVNWSILP